MRLHILVPTLGDLSYVFPKGFTAQKSNTFSPSLSNIYHTPKKPQISARTSTRHSWSPGGLRFQPLQPHPTFPCVSSHHPDFGTSVRTSGRSFENLPSQPTDPTDVIPQNQNGAEAEKNRKPLTFKTFKRLHKCIN